MTTLIRNSLTATVLLATCARGQNAVSALIDSRYICSESCESEYGSVVDPSMPCAGVCTREICPIMVDTLFTCKNGNDLCVGMCDFGCTQNATVTAQTALVCPSRCREVCGYVCSDEYSKLVVGAVYENRTDDSIGSENLESVQLYENEILDNVLRVFMKSQSGC